MKRIHCLVPDNQPNNVPTIVFISAIKHRYYYEWAVTFRSWWAATSSCMFVCLPNSWEQALFTQNLYRAYEYSVHICQYRHEMCIFAIRYINSWLWSWVSTLCTDFCGPDPPPLWLSAITIFPSFFLLLHLLSLALLWSLQHQPSPVSTSQHHPPPVTWRSNLE